MDSNPSDYSREYYDHYDTIEVVYNTGTNTFSYKPRSQLSSHMRKGMKPKPLVKNSALITNTQVTNFYI